MIKEDLSSPVETIKTKTIIQKIFKRYWLVARKNFNIKLLNKALLFAVIVLGVYYFTGINDLAVKGFELQDLNNQKNILDSKNQQLENEVLSLKSLTNVNERIKDLDMVAVGTDIDYVSTGGSAVAMK